MDANIFNVIDVSIESFVIALDSSVREGRMPPGKCVSNPVWVLAVGVVALIGDGNHLQGDAAPGFKEAVECGEIGAIVGVTYRFKHLIDTMRSWVPSASR